jgi:hypothetical protein
VLERSSPISTDRRVEIFLKTRSQTRDTLGATTSDNWADKLHLLLVGISVRVSPTHVTNTGRDAQVTSVIQILQPECRGRGAGQLLGRHPTVNPHLRARKCTASLSPARTRGWTRINLNDCKLTAIPMLPGRPPCRGVRMCDVLHCNVKTKCTSPLYLPYSVCNGVDIGGTEPMRIEK